MATQIKDAYVVDIFSENIERCTFKRGRKTLDYSALRSEIAQEMGITDLFALRDVDKQQITQKMNEIYNKYKNSLSQNNLDGIKNVASKYLPNTITELSQELIDGFAQYIGWSSDELGNKMYFCRTDSLGRTWEIIEDVLTYVRSHKYNGKYIIEWMSFYYYKSVAKNGPIEYRVVAEDGSWGDPISEVALYRIALGKAYKAGELNENECTALLNSLTFKQHHALDPINSSFNQAENGWLWRMWSQSMGSVMSFPQTLTNDPTVDAFSYIDLTALTDGATPFFDGWCESLDPIFKPLFMAAIFAAVKEDAHISQLTWLYGQGGNGKSTILDALTRAFGPSMVGPISAKDATEQNFGLESAIGKRIIYVGDLQSGNFLNTNFVHAVTGGDTLNINRKNEKHMHYKFQSILMVGANMPPEINMGAYNEARRIIYIEMHEPSKETMSRYCQTDANGEIDRYETGMPIFKGFDLVSHLVEEMPSILYKCQQEFNTYYGYGTLIVSKEAFSVMCNGLSSTETDLFDKFISDALIFDPAATVPVIDVETTYVTYIHGKNADICKYGFEVRDLKRMLTTKLSGKKPSRIVIDGKRINSFVGLKINTKALYKDMSSDNETDLKDFLHPATIDTMEELL